MKNFLSNCLIFLLVFAGTVILGWSFIEEPVMQYLTHVEVVPEEFEANLAYATEHAEFDMEAITAVGWAGLLPYINEEVSPVGEIIIPSVEIHLPLLHGATDANMSLGVGTLFPDRRMGTGNFALASHWMPQPGLLFASLSQVEMGDMIFLRDAHYVYAYEIFENKEVDVYRVDVIDDVEDRAIVTLVTCTPDMIRRVIVQGELVEQISIEELLSADGTETANTITEVVDLTEVIEILEPVVVAFPTLEVAAVGMGAFSFASLVILIASRSIKRQKR